jgi:hypothetical protein
MPTFTRGELYHLVWSKPTSKVSTRFGLSDRGLGKLCARHGIPTPPRGWWAKKAAGKSVQCLPLPPPRRDQPTTVTIKVRPKREQPAGPLPPEIAFERDPANAIVVRPTRLTHPLIRATRSVDVGIEAGRKQQRPLIDVRMSKHLVSRALRILEAFVYAAEARGYAVDVVDDVTTVHACGVAIQISLREHPAGQLAFWFGDGCLCWRSVGDGKTRPLEACLNRFMESVIRRALKERTRQAAREREAELQRQAAERYGEMQLRVRAEHGRREHFDALARRGEFATQRRAFLAQLREVVGEVAADSELGQWLVWADGYCRTADPLNRFHKRADRRLKVYYNVTWGTDREAWEAGQLTDPEPRGDARTLVGIPLCDTPPGGSALDVELPEDVLLPYEVPETGQAPRRFVVPARVLNAYRLACNEGHEHGADPR